MPPFGGPEQVLKYLAHYTHRVAISNARLLGFEDGMVRFRYKDYAHGNRKRVLTLTAVEFVRRLLLHVLPTGFQRIRHYGILANRHRQAKLAWCRQLLGSGTAAEPESAEETRETRESPSSITPIRVCPVCGAGRMIVIKELPPMPVGREAPILFGTNFAPGDWHDICAMPSCVPVRFPGWHGGSDGQTTSTSFAAE